jgi:hypothetical protein
VEVVDQPLRRRRDRAFVLDRLRQGAVGLQQDAAVVGDALPDRAPDARLRGDLLGGCQRLAVLFETLDAEDLGDDRFGVFRLAV